jgi:uncharacterized protein YbjT (DUF2867 family)
MTVLVTGSTGTLGATVITALFEAREPVRGLSRHGPSGVLGDLHSGEGIEAAFDGIDTVVHCAQMGTAKDITMAANLVAASRRADVSHIVLISIVGCDVTPIGFYRQRTEIEHAIERSGIPFTLQRATQFHQLVAKVFDAQRHLPVAFVPRLEVQPVEVAEVGHRLATLALGAPRGRVPDIGGPETLPARDFFAQWRAAEAPRKASVSFSVPGGLGRALREHRNVVPGPPFGIRTFAQFLAER